MIIRDVRNIRVNKVFPDLTVIELDNGQYVDINSNEFQISVDRESTRGHFRVTIIKK